MEVGRSAFSEMNNNLCSFAMRWELDGDYLRCRKCNRPQITDYANVNFVHKADCKAAGNVEPRPWETFAQLLSPLTRALSGEKAGPVGDGLPDENWFADQLCELRNKWAEGCEDNWLETDDNHPDDWMAKELRKRLLALPASPTPDKEGK